MARTTWSVSILQSGGSYLADGGIYRPNDNTSIDLTTTQLKVPLADGSNAFITSETKYQKESIAFVWLQIDESDTFRSKIENYIKNQDYLKITTHLGEVYKGRFTYVRRIWLLGVEDTYDLQAGFDQIELT